MSDNENTKKILDQWQTAAKKRQEHAQTLLNTIKTHLPEIEELLKTSQSHWVGEDSFYRFYHQSFKVYRLQEKTKQIVALLEKIGREADLKILNPYFIDILNEGTQKTFDLSHNQRWTQETRPILEAFFHAREMLHLQHLYGKTLKQAPTTLPSGWAAILYLYNIR